jgi:hypothetical protein
MHLHLHPITQHTTQPSPYVSSSFLFFQTKFFSPSFQNPYQNIWPRNIHIKIYPAIGHWSHFHPFSSTPQPLNPQPLLHSFLPIPIPRTLLPIRLTNRPTLPPTGLGSIADTPLHSHPPITRQRSSRRIGCVGTVGYMGPVSIMRRMRGLRPGSLERVHRWMHRPDSLSIYGHSLF